jgi:hypothetical protein
MQLPLKVLSTRPKYLPAVSTPYGLRDAPLHAWEKGEAVKRECCSGVVAKVESMDPAAKFIHSYSCNATPPPTMTTRERERDVEEEKISSLEKLSEMRV